MTLAELLVKLGLDASELGRGLDTAESRFASFGSSMTSLGAGMSATITAPLLGIGAAALKAGQDWDDAIDRIRVGTGATGPLLTSLSKSFSTVFTSVPASAGAASTAIAELNTRLGLTGAPLEALASQLLNLARVTGEEVGPLITSTTRLFGDWSVETERQSASLDMLFRISQATGAEVGSLSQLLVQFGAPLRQMGFDLDTAAALLGKFHQEGVNTELVMGSLRIALTRMAKEGIEDPAEALKILTQRIKDAGSAGQANAIALQTFGARAGPDMAAAIREGRFEIAELLKTISSGTETINKAARETDGFAEKWTLFKNKMVAALEPLGTSLLRVLDNFLDAAAPIIEWIRRAVEWFGSLSTTTQTVIVSLAAAAAAIGPVIAGVGLMSTGLSTLIGALGTATTSVGGLATAKGALAGTISASLIPAVTALGIALIAIGFKEVATEAGSLIEALTYTREKTDEAKASTDSYWQSLLNLFKPAVTATTGEVSLLGQVVSDLGDRFSKWDWKSFVIPQLTGLRDALQNVTAAVKALRGVFPEMDKAVEDTAKKLQASVKAHDKLSDSQLAALASARGLTEKISDGNKALKDYTKSTGDASKGVDRLLASKKKTKEATKDLGEETVALTNALNDAIAASSRQVKQYVLQEATQRDLTEHSYRLLGVMQSITTQAADLTRATKGLTEAQAQVKSAINQHEQAWKTLGITSGASVAKQAEEFRKAYEYIAGQADATMREITEAWVKAERAQMALIIEQGGKVDAQWKKTVDQVEADLKRQTDVTGAEAKKQESIWGSLSNQVSTIFTDLGKGVADAILHGKSLGEVFTNVFNEMKEAGLRFVIEFLQEKLFKTLANLVDDILPGVGKKLAEVLGVSIGGGAKAVETGLGLGAEAGEVAGQVGGAGGAAGQAVGAGLSGVVGAVSGVVGAVSGIIGNFQMAGMNKSLDLIEHETRFSQIHLLNLLEKANIFWPNLETLNEYNYTHQIRALGEINDSIQDIGHQLRHDITPLLIPQERSGQSAIIKLIMDGRQIAEAIVDDITDIQGRELKRVAGLV